LGTMHQSKSPAECQLHLNLLLWHQPYNCTQIGVWIIFFLLLIQVRYDGPNQPEERRLQFWGDSPRATDREETGRSHHAQRAAESCYLGNITSFVHHPLPETHKGQSPDDTYECLANHVSRPLQG